MKEIERPRSSPDGLKFDVGDAKAKQCDDKPPIFLIEDEGQGEEQGTPVSRDEMNFGGGIWYGERSKRGRVEVMRRRRREKKKGKEKEEEV
jgi:hypothetical protein